MSAPTYELNESVKSAYTHLRFIPGRGWCGVHRLLYHWTVHIGLDDFGYEERYCYATEHMAKESVDAWDGAGDPPGGWHKHPDSGRRRDPVTGEIWQESEYRPEGVIS